MSKGRHEVRMSALSGMAGDCFRPFLFHSVVFCLFLAVAQLENIKSLDPLLYSHLTHQKYIRIK